MAGLRAVVLTASIDNQAEIERWLRSVKQAATKIERDIEDLSHMLREAPHIAIHLHQGDES